MVNQHQLFDLDHSNPPSNSTSLDNDFAAGTIFSAANVTTTNYPTVILLMPLSQLHIIKTHALNRKQLPLVGRW